MDYSHVVLQAHELYTRSNGTHNASDSKDGRPPVYKVIGIILAVTSGLFIGISFVLKKHGLLKANAKYNEEAGEGYGYLKNAWWWSGMTLMIIGEICNFVAYAFVDAIMVTPLGALSVVVTTILSAIFLKERLSFVGKVGCFNCIVGSIVIVINAPEQSAVATIQDMRKLVLTPGFLVYGGIVVIGCVVVALFVAPKYGKKSMLVYLSICSLIGGLSVVCTQGLGAAIISQISGTPQFNQWFLYIVLVFVITTLVTEIIYLNKALNLFNAALVTPTYYVFFTSATIITSAVLFQGFKGTPATIATVIMGFLQICSGVILLQLSKSAKDVPDAAVFKGDLDQVRTIAEQEEPEYEPRADTIRGGGAIIRSISRMRSMRELGEVKTLHEETLSPVAENEMVEWDGLRRRKTVLTPGQSPVPRAKTLHPPLGMSHFPGDDDTASTADTDIHPGFFPWRRRSRGHSSATHQGVPLSPIRGSIDDGPRKPSTSSSARRPHIFGLPTGLSKGPAEAIIIGDGQSDAEFPAASPHIHFADQEKHTISHDNGQMLTPPRPPPHSARRQFSFQNVFHRNRAPSSEDNASLRPDSSGRVSSRLSFHRKNSVSKVERTTEEERLGLVHGDSRNMLGPLTERSSGPPSPNPPSYSDVDPLPGEASTREASPALDSLPASSPEPPQRHGVHALPPLPFESVDVEDRGAADMSDDDSHADDLPSPSAGRHSAALSHSERRAYLRHGEERGR